MFKKSNKGYYFWEEFSRNEGIIHGFSTRKFGDMNVKSAGSNKNLSTFLHSLLINKKYIVKMNQVHGNNISLVSFQDHKKTIDNTDGLISQEKGIFLIGSFADCVPVLFFDKAIKVFGIVHSGWKGTYKEIVKNMVSKMVDTGSIPSDILVGIGPSIKVCCYNIDKDRETLFASKFSKWKNKIFQRKSKNIFLDLQTLIKLQLLESGILIKDIKDSKICTKDNIVDFYSYRKEFGKNSFGHFVGVIGRI